MDGTLGLVGTLVFTSKTLYWVSEISYVALAAFGLCAVYAFP